MGWCEIAGICAQVASEGVDSNTHAVAVDAALAVLEGLEAQFEVGWSV